MKDPHEMTTVTQVIDMLRDKGYNEDFIMTDEGFKGKQNNVFFEPDELTIVKVYRFEGDSNPDDMAVVYAMESSDGNKGIFIDAFGTYADYDGQKLAEFFKHVHTSHQE